jgi:hypothetical protein
LGRDFPRACAHTGWGLCWILLIIIIRFVGERAGRRGHSRVRQVPPEKFAARRAAARALRGRRQAHYASQLAAASWVVPPNALALLSNSSDWSRTPATLDVGWIGFPGRLSWNGPKLFRVRGVTIIIAGEGDGQRCQLLRAGKYTKCFPNLCRSYRGEGGLGRVTLGSKKQHVSLAHISRPRTWCLM